MHPKLSHIDIQNYETSKHCIHFDGSLNKRSSTKKKCNYKENAFKNINMYT